MDNFFSQISTSFIFEEICLRNLPIMHLQNSVRDLEYLGSFIYTTIKSLLWHHIGDEYARIRKVFTQPRSNLIVHGRILPRKG